jgi:hypothetical protein
MAGLAASSCTAGRYHGKKIRAGVYDLKRTIWNVHRRPGYFDCRALMSGQELSRWRALTTNTIQGQVKILWVSNLKSKINSDSSLHPQGFSQASKGCYFIFPSRIAGEARLSLSVWVSPVNDRPKSMTSPITVWDFRLRFDWQGYESAQAILYYWCGQRKDRYNAIKVSYSPHTRIICYLPNV